MTEIFGNTLATPINPNAFSGGGNGTVDKTYNPQSENAQSGKAVAEGIEKNNKCYVNLTFANALKGSKSGSAIVIDDVSPVEHELSVKLENKNLLISPFANTQITTSGITFIPNDDGTVTLNGVNDGTSYSRLNYQFYKKLILPLGTYSLHSSNDVCKFTIQIKQTNGSYRYGANGTFYINEGETIVGMWVQVSKGETTVFENTVVYPQLEFGTEATPYIPYIADFSNVEVKKIGKNLLDIKNADIINGYVASSDKISISNATRSIVLKCLPNTTYTSSKSLGTRFDMAYTAEYPKQDTLCVKGTKNNSGVVTITTDNTAKYLVIYYYHGNYDTDISAEDILNTVQLEFGSTTSEYEPCQAQTVNANADGTVEGLTSLSPNMTILTNTDGVIITTDYNRDINKAFAELEQVIISLGGNI